MPDDESGGGVDTLADDGEPDRGTFYTRVPRAGEPENDTLAPADRGAGIPRLSSGHSWDEHRKHPPIPCNNPRIAATYRGYYACPACGGKVRLVGYRTWTESGYDLCDGVWSVLGPAFAQAWYIGVDLVVCIARAAWWVCCKLVRKRSVKERTGEEKDAYYGVQIPAQTVIALAMLAKVAASQKGETSATMERHGAAPRPRTTEESAEKDTEKMEKAKG